MSSFLNIFLPDYIVAKYCYRADKKCRKELYIGNIANERDYVSNLMQLIRSFFLFRFWRHKIYAYVLNGSLEQQFGCDAIIIFKKKNKVKIGMFEAKYPRVINDPSYSWDKLNKTTRLSHFSEQIEKQHLIFSDVAVWEMFFLEEDSGIAFPPFDLYGSSCIWHQDAHNYMNTHGKRTVIWNNSDLNSLLKKNCTNLYQIIFDILCCKKGVKKDINLSSNIIRIEKGKNNYVDIPLPIKKDNEYIDSGRITNFLSEFGLRAYFFIDFNTNSSF